MRAHTADTVPLSAPASNVAAYHGCPVFSAGDWYNAPVLHAPADPQSARYIASMRDGGDTQGFVVYDADPPAFRVNLATNATPKYPVHAVAWHQNEFPKPVPWMQSYFIEPQSDGHAMVLNTQTCELIEFYQAKFEDGRLSAYSGWSWSLSRPLRSPSGHQPSSTASGLPLFAGMVKGEEIESAAPIDHALNMGVPAGAISARLFTLPATSTGGCDGCADPSRFGLPYGAHLRLHADFSLSCGDGCPQSQRIVRALKVYGAYVSDIGSKGTGNQLWVALDAYGRNPWNHSDLENLSQIHITDMDVLQVVRHD